jgi:hypothetical protein
MPPCSSTLAAGRANTKLLNSVTPAQGGDWLKAMATSSATATQNHPVHDRSLNVGHNDSSNTYARSYRSRIVECTIAPLNSGATRRVPNELEARANPVNRGSRN